MFYWSPVELKSFLDVPLPEFRYAANQIDTAPEKAVIIEFKMNIVEENTHNKILEVIMNKIFGDFYVDVVIIYISKKCERLI